MIQSCLIEMLKSKILHHRLWLDGSPGIFYILNFLFGVIKSGFDRVKGFEVIYERTTVKTNCHKSQTKIPCLAVGSESAIKQGYIRY